MEQKGAGWIGNFQEFRHKLNAWGKAQRPCLFIIDFECQRPLLWALDEVEPAEVCYDFNGRSNVVLAPSSALAVPALLHTQPVSAAYYQEAYAGVAAALQRGDSFLVNLTFPTEVQLSGNLREVFAAAQARYRLCYRNEWVCFSPESFVRIQNQRIYSYPMKGTRSALDPDAAAALLADPKEKAEHATIVDLIRNDLSRVATRVMVEEYRYLEKIVTARGPLWQTSSRIAGDLPADYTHNLGDIMAQLLPAGSVSGAPKVKTLEVIRAAEQQPRGYYTGIAGIFDGKNLDSCVLIRFLEATDTGWRYWSGGGVTAQSNWQDEYAEMRQKVYLPIQTAALASF